jgi:hypothetical protein
MTAHAQGVSNKKGSIQHINMIKAARTRKAGQLLKLSLKSYLFSYEFNIISGIFVAENI